MKTTTGGGTLVRGKTGVSQKWNEVIFDDRRLQYADGLSIRSISELTTPAAVLVDRLYFEGLDVLHCYRGSFRITVGTREPAVIGEGEVFVTYPNQHVTIEAIGKENQLVYGIFTGETVVDYFDSLGFFDGFWGRSSSQYNNMKTLQAMMADEKSAHVAGRKACVSFLTDILVSICHDVQAHGNPIVFAAIRQIRENVRNRIVRLEPLCEQLRVSRVHLHRVFASARIGTPAEFIRAEQLRLALRLLSDPTRSIRSVAEEAGFMSPCHFATFVSRMTGMSPSDFRRKGAS